MADKLSRLDFLRSAALPIAMSGNAWANSSTGSGAREWSATGAEWPALASFDTTMRSFMEARNIPGGSLAVTRNGQLVLARGYTFSNDSEDLAVEPDSLFRVASLSKPVTAVAILRLVQDGKLDLSAKLMDLLDLAPLPGRSPDRRLDSVTVRHLLQHLGGWDRDLTFDPTFHDSAIAEELGVSLPISKADIATFMTGRPIDHLPGTTYAYCNYGYSLLGQIIERIAGESYQAYVNRQVFQPLGVVRPALGRTRPEHRLMNEVRYHTQFSGQSVLEDCGQTVPNCYGAVNFENQDAQGAWLASAVDLVRFASTFDDPASSPVLDPASVAKMYSLPENIAPSAYTPGDGYYACGWLVRDWRNGNRNTWHGGSQPGTSSLLARRWDGLDWCVLFNQRDDASGLSYGAIDGLLHDAADAVTQWPDHDLFDDYLSPVHTCETEG